MDYPICASYLAEMTPKHKTNRYMAIAMFINCLSAPIGVLVAWGIYILDPSLSAWRWILASGAVPAVIALIFRSKLPESFLWKAQQQLATIKASKTTTTTAYKKIFSRRAYLKATIGLCSAWFLMDVAYYGIGLFTPSILSALHLDSHSNFLTSAPSVIKSTLYISSIVCLGSLVSIFAIDRIENVRLQKLGFFL